MQKKRAEEQQQQIRWRNRASIEPQYHIHAGEEGRGAAARDTPTCNRGCNRRCNGSRGHQAGAGLKEKNKSKTNKTRLARFEAVSRHRC
jgi:hypothetical protein